MILSVDRLENKTEEYYTFILKGVFGSP